MVDAFFPSAGLDQQQSMAGVQALKAAKKELRILMKEKLATIPKASLDRQSVPHHPLFLQKMISDLHQVGKYLKLCSI